MLYLEGPLTLRPVGSSMARCAVKVAAEVMEAEPISQNVLPTLPLGARTRSTPLSRIQETPEPPNYRTLMLIIAMVIVFVAAFAVGARAEGQRGQHVLRDGLGLHDFGGNLHRASGHARPDGPECQRPLKVEHALALGQVMMQACRRGQNRLKAISP